TVDGVDVPAEEFLYWVTSTADQLSQYMGAIDWEADIGDGTTVKEYMLNNATETAKLYQVVANHAKDMGVKFSAEDQKKYNEELATMKTQLATQLSSKDEDLSYVQWVSTMGLSDQGFESINQVSYLFKSIRESLYGEGGKEVPTAEELSAWADESGTLRAKHILIKAVASEDGADDGMAAALEKANTVRAELKTAGDTETAFDELMTKYSEDVNASTGEQNCGPEGYTFTSGQMVDEFYDGTKALEVGAVSEPIQSTYGYHIILRLDVKDAYADDKANALVDQWVTDAKVETTEAYDKLDLNAFYTKLGELRTTISAQMYPATETPAPTGSAAPDSTGTPVPETSGSPAPTATPAAAG
ncbi:MAG: hypothetical protein EOM52_08560, partial [Clostridia bacterium]|nr:hypothetical protein [Clostridia bacterium]